MLRYTLKSELAILQSLFAFPYMTVKQITRLLYSPNSKRSLVNPLMKDMWEPKPRNIVSTKDYKEYVLRAPLYTQEYAREYCYWLSDKGRDVLRKEGYDFTGWKEPRKMAQFLRSYHFPHYQEVTDFLIETTLLSDVNQNLTVPMLLHDFTIKRIRRGSIETDGWFNAHYLTSGKNRYYCVEIDRKKEEEVAFSDKIGSILYFIDQGEYQNLYHAHEEEIVIPRWLFFTSQGTQRGKWMLSLIEQKLRTMYQEEHANWFRVLSTEGVPFTVTMYFEEMWEIPNPSGGKRQQVSIFGM